MTNQPESARILLVDFDDPRRETRVRLLEWSWLRSDSPQGLYRIGKTGPRGKIRHDDPGSAPAGFEQSRRVQRTKPELPILLLTDVGVYAPKGTLSKSVETDGYAALLKTVAKMFASSTELIRQLSPRARRAKPRLATAQHTRQSQPWWEDAGPRRGPCFLRFRTSDGLT